MGAAVPGWGEYLILLANVLQRILHQVLLITRIKIYRHCSTINFTEDYFRQQYQYFAKVYLLRPKI